MALLDQKLVRQGSSDSIDNRSVASGMTEKGSITDSVPLRDWSNKEHDSLSSDVRYVCLGCDR